MEYHRFADWFKKKNISEDYLPPFQGVYDPKKGDRNSGSSVVPTEPVTPKNLADPTVQPPPVIKTGNKDRNASVRHHFSNDPGRTSINPLAELAKHKSEILKFIEAHHSDKQLINIPVSLDLNGKILKIGTAAKHLDDYATHVVISVKVFPDGTAHIWDVSSSPINKKAFHPTQFTQIEQAVKVYKKYLDDEIISL